ncbi:RNA-binding domain-containing protein [Marinilactibacillus sp. Marseille-P9653]|uniref:RNA-binding domain-containing protein n=1 Tax=Marinilactibacillus sp. Marseille-P9653 TaxID=2866583 RepID=UPI001CE448BD|nr:RNA-binding domain-containing protein [Marinilactibacillus sp. Marseille-P9653]
MTPIRKRQLSNEGKHLEYKTAKNALPKDFWETYSSFANTEGGLVVLGVAEPKKGEFEVVGINSEAKILSDLFNSLNNKQKVNFNCISEKDVQVRVIDEKKVIEIKVPEAPQSKKPIYLNGNIKKTYIREYEGDRHASEDELKYMIRNSKDNLDSELLDNYDITDLNSSSVESYRRMLIGQDENSKYHQMSQEDILIEIGAYKKDRTSSKGKYKLSLGGLLFFGNYQSITELVPHFHLDYQYKTSSNERWIDRVATGDPSYTNLNIFEFFRIVLDKLKITLADEFKLDENLSRSRVTTDFEIALRESLANALIHADYYFEEPIKVEAYRGYYIFSNPGNMRISVEEFLRGGDSKPRNNTIVTLFRRVGLCERAGSGGPKIFQAAERNKLKLPDVKNEAHKTIIKLWKIDIVDSHPELNDNEKKILRYILKSISSVSSSEIRDNLKITKYYFDQAIKNLIDKKIIVQEGKGRSTKYALNQSTSEYLAQLQHAYKQLEEFYINN